MRFRAAALIVSSATVGVLAARGQQDGAKASQPEDHSAIVGTWQLDEAHSKLSAENWRSPRIVRREFAPCLPTLTRPGEPETYDCKSAYQLPQAGPPNAMGEAALLTFGRPLLDASPTLTFIVGASSVTIGGDLLETRTYATNGKPEKISVIVHHSPRWPSARDVSVQTEWSGTTLVQQVKATWSGVEMKVTETFLPALDGQQLFVMIDVPKPTLKPPVKPIRRVYARSKVQEKF